MFVRISGVLGDGAFEVSSGKPGAASFSAASFSAASYPAQEARTRFPSILADAPLKVAPLDQPQPFNL